MRQNLSPKKCLGQLGRGHQPKEIGILYRANAQAKPIELALRETRIAYRTFGGQSFFERREVKDFLAYLRLVLNHEDRLALWRVINTPQPRYRYKDTRNHRANCQSDSANRLIR